jgi:hypothetical protein
MSPAATSASVALTLTWTPSWTGHPDRAASDLPAETSVRVIEHDPAGQRIGGGDRA